MNRLSRLSTIVSVIIFLVTFAAAVPGAYSASDKNEPVLDWLQGFTLVELDSDDVASMYSARSLIESYGGQIAILSPPSLLMGWVPFESRDELIGRAHIKDIYFTDVLPGEVNIKDEQTRHMVSYFNRVIRGEYQEQYRRFQSSAPAADRRMLRSDVRERESFDEQAYFENLTDNGFDLQRLRDKGLLLGRSTYEAAGNSDKMMGTVATTLIFVESDGTGADPNTYTWTDQHVQDYIAGVNTGMAWWSSRARYYNDCWVAFFVRYFAPTDSRCQNWREMVLHSSGEVPSMVSELMANFGYTFGNHMARVDAFNTAQRSTYGTDWSYTGFIAYNPPPAPAELTDGAAAFAYRGGPYTFLLYRSYSWAAEQVFAHESGHIFWACDEYAGGCFSSSCVTVCANGVVNGNCEVCSSSVPCMMKANSWALCAYTDDHVGWQINPCAPTPLNPPAVSAVLPASGYQGTELEITVEGSDFLYGAYAELGAGITITSTELVGTDSLRLSITIDNGAEAGPRDVAVTNRDMQEGQLAGGFEVSASTRHYVSTTGGNEFPYLTPSSAAVSIDDAIDAAGEGDSVLVESTTIWTLTIMITKGITLSGAWTSGFTGRDLVTGKTTLDLTGNVYIGSGGSEAVVEGFRLQNGHGSWDPIPMSGDYGGAVKVIGSTAKIADCEILQNQATTGAGFGGGGGVFGYNSTVTVEDCSIHDNTATYGGGIYLYDCSGTITGSTIADNSVSTVSGKPVGGGIALEFCQNVTLAGCTIDGNTGGADGGGMWIRKSTGIVVDGGVVSYNAASFTGAGVHVMYSEVDLSGVTFTRNASSALGGAVAVTDTSVAALSECALLWNTALVGGGVYVLATGPDSLSFRHNLFVGNGATSTGGGLYATGLTKGEVVGNTMDRNDGGSGAGGIAFANCPVEMFNNVVTNSIGHGVGCSGTLPTLMYNDVWNSSGDDYNGCAAGTGSIALDPAFVDTASVDYHLGVHSPAIDAGRPGAAYDDPDGSPGDMGRYGSHAFVMDQPSYPQNLVAEIESGDVVLRWASNPEGDLDVYAVYSDPASGFKPAASNFVQFVAAPDTTVNLGAAGDTTYYKVSAVDNDGYAGGYSDEASASGGTAAGDVVRYVNTLHQNVPNPFNPTTTIRYELEARTSVTLTVYDVGGRLVKQLENNVLPAGSHETVWNGTNERGEQVSSGVYFYKLSTPTFTQTRKMILLK